LTDEDLLSEVGDVLYYLDRLAQIKGWTLEDVMIYNKKKLDARRGFK
jgi:phosphoribosyl-ATP pyrophosphohydrolase